MRLYDASELEVVVKAQDTMIIEMLQKYPRVDYKDFVTKFINSDFKKCLDQGDPAYFGLFGLGLLNRFLAYEQNVSLTNIGIPYMNMKSASRVLCNVSCLSRQEGVFSSEILKREGLDKLELMNYDISNKEIVALTLKNISEKADVKSRNKVTVGVTNKVYDTVKFGAIANMDKILEIGSIIIKKSEV